MSIELIPPPVQGAEEPFADFMERHRAWWRERDITVRSAMHNDIVSTLESVGPSVAPTLEKIAVAWDAFDVRLGELASALSHGDGGGVSEPTLLEAMRISRGVDGG